MKRRALLVFKILLWIIAGVITLVLLVFILIQIPAVQNFARKKVVTYLEGKIKTKVEIKKLSLNFPKLLVLEDIYFEDQKQDTLLAGDTLKVDISLFKLLNNEVEINEMDLRGIRANISRTMPDSTFNFDYIIKSFVSEHKKEPKQQDTAAAMKFSVDKINLDRIKFTYQDEVIASDIDFYLGHFDTRIKEFDLDKMKFSLPKIVMSGVNAKIIQRKLPLKNESAAKVEKDSNEPFKLDLKLKTIDFSKIRVNYQNDVSALKSDINIGKLLAEVDFLNLNKQRVSIKNLSLNNSSSLIVLGKSTGAKVVAKQTEQEVKAQLNNGWQVSVANIDWGNNNLQFDNFNLPQKKLGIDYAHLGISNLNVKAQNFYYSSDTISGNIGNISFSNKNGFVLNQLRTNFLYDPTGAYLDKLYIKTPQTTLQNYISVNYPSLESISKNPGSITIKADLINSQLSFKDILTFVPTLAGTDPFKSDPNAVIKINGNVNGKLADLNIPKLEISGLLNTRIKTSAHITGLPDMNKANFNIPLLELSSSQQDLNKLIGKGKIPANIRLPETFNLKGDFNGSISSFKTNMQLSSTYGSAKAIAQMNSGKRKGAEVFNANVQLNDFNAGRLIKQEKNIGKITATAKVSGTGTNPKNMSAKFSGEAQKAELKGYAYRNLVFNGNIANQNVTAFAKINDRNIKLTLNAKANIKETYPAINFVLDVDSINFQKLKLYKEDLRFRGKIVANMPSTNPDRLIGTVDASNLLVVSKGKRYQLDSVSLAATIQNEEKDIRIRSEFLTANLTGQYKLTEIGNVFTNEINRYFKITDKQRLPVSSQPNFSFALKVVNNPVLQSFVPQLTRLETVNITGSYEGEGNLKIDGNIPKIVYAANTIDSARINIITDGQALNYSLNVDKISTSSLQINKTSIEGKAQDNTLSINLNVKDKEDKDKYRIAGLFSVLPNQYQFSLTPNGLMLKYDPWTVSEDNAILFGKAGILARNFQISQGGQSLAVNSNPQQPNAPITVDFTKFKIETFTAISEKDSLLVGGTIDGNAVLSNLNTNPVFTSDLMVRDFNFRTDTVGDISLKVNNKQANTYAANITITGKGNDLALDGEYYVQPGNKSSFDFDLNIKNLNLASIEGFTMGNLKQASGSINGKLKLTGTTAAPAVRGDINFNQAAFNVAKLDAYYRIDNEKINFDADGIQFNTFTLIDSVGNKAVLDGKIYTRNFMDYRFALNLTTDNFKAMSSSKKDNKLFYGDVFLSSNLRIRGDMNKPAVDGSVKINDKTALTVVLPQRNPGVVERDGVVEFIDKDNPENNKTFTSGLDTLNKSQIKGIDVSVNIEIDSNAVLSLIVDELNGDFLRVQGAAELTAGMDPSGKVSLTGTYELAKGSYELSFNFLRRRFEIQKGSTITWTGEPTAANVDVTAVYTANTSPLDLVENQLGDISATVRNTYKQKLPFEVLLNMKGELLKPVITFDIHLPSEKNLRVSKDILNTVETRLTQLKAEPSELNKQVFALLLLNRFVGENPFASSVGGSGVESIARNSVSTILSDQLNKLAENLVQGVDLNFDLVSSEDYSTGAMKNRTDLNVGLSKQLLNDRLKVSIGSNFELEGSTNTNRGLSNIAGNIALDYKLSKDGRYMLRAYRRNEYQGVVDGYIIETGVGFVITLDYNKFKEIFSRKKDNEKEDQKENQLINTDN
ncbi:MAG: translocation/assembly module TamB domain-containing protein [Daejeonella sp.]